MEDAKIGAALLLLCGYLVGFMMLTLEFDRRREILRQSTQRARERRAKRRKLLRKFGIFYITMAQREMHCFRRRRKILLRLCALRSSPSVWVYKREDDWWKTVVPSFTDHQWIENFRMSKETFQYICRRVQPAMEKMDTRYRLSVPLQKRVAVALWKLATNAEYRTVAHLFGVGIATACDCVRDFCSSVLEILMPEVIQVPTAEKLNEMTLYFEQRWGLPQCVGSIGSSHIPILAPLEFHTEYINRKGWCSILLQTVVDGNGLFWNVFAGLPGSLPSARVLRLSPLWKLAERGMLFPQQQRCIGGQGVDHYILGDADYPLRSWLMTPFTDDGRLTEGQHVYNYTTSKARVVVENAFDRLKGRWRCLLERNDCSLERVKSMVLTSCVLHNLCESNGEEYREEWDKSVPFAQPDEPLAPGAETEGMGVRAALVHYLTTVDN
ncbi:uncharacterized protein LOC127442481 [Myxocyprinus asiaticus]|uniref:uncharacterized protein LOC127442481 n=1 Tax=Myxocyprinus asiaticus TaxID=70543 RepID=UPI0022230C7C|nr:uncharacterized protein LOC127442481 [Myxocyprinus asiaticus]